MSQTHCRLVVAVKARNHARESSSLSADCFSLGNLWRLTLAWSSLGLSVRGHGLHSSGALVGNAMRRPAGHLHAIPENAGDRRGFALSLYRHYRGDANGCLSRGNQGLIAGSEGGESLRLSSRIPPWRGDAGRVYSCIVLFPSANKMNKGAIVTAVLLGGADVAYLVGPIPYLLLVAACFTILERASCKTDLHGGTV